MPTQNAGPGSDRAAAELPTSSFAFVMATGIVSIAAAMLGYPWIARALLALNAVAFVALAALTGDRLVRRPAALLADFRDHRKGPGFLTIVAGTNVLGEQISVLTAH